MGRELFILLRHCGICLQLPDVRTSFHLACQYYAIVFCDDVTMQPSYFAKLSPFIASLLRSSQLMLVFTQCVKIKTAQPHTSKPNKQLSHPQQVHRPANWQGKASFQQIHRRKTHIQPSPELSTSPPARQNITSPVKPLPPPPRHRPWFRQPLCSAPPVVARRPFPAPPLVLPPSP